MRPAVFVDGCLILSRVGLQPYSLRKEEVSLRREPYYKGGKGQMVNIIDFAGLTVFVAASWALPLWHESSHRQCTTNESACVLSGLYLWALNLEFI